METHREQRGARTGRRRPVGAEGSRGRTVRSHTVAAVGMAGRQGSRKPTGSCRPGCSCRALCGSRELGAELRRGCLRPGSPAGGDFPPPPPRRRRLWGLLGADTAGICFGEENLGRSPRLCPSQRLSPVTEVWVSVLLPAVHPPPSWPRSSLQPPWEPERGQSQQVAQADADSPLQVTRHVFRDQLR